MDSQQRWRDVKASVKSVGNASVVAIADAEKDVYAVGSATALVTFSCALCTL
jgi:hypothetical protein